MQPLPDRVQKLLLSGDSPVVGPVTARQLREYAAQAEPAAPAQEQVGIMIGKLAMATAQAKVSDAEAAARLEMYWIALRDIPADDLRAAFVDLVKTAKFLPTPAEVRKAALSAGAIRRYTKSRASHLAWKHEQEWKPEGERVDPAEVRALLSKHGIAA